MLAPLQTHATCPMVSFVWDYKSVFNERDSAQTREIVISLMYRVGQNS